MTRSFFIIAGEASGDLHASNLIKALRQRHPNAQFTGLGGDKMRDAGCVLYQDYRKMAYMGVLAVLKNIGNVRRNFRIAEQALLYEQPNVLILIDYPSFNLRIAQFAKTHLPNTKIVYYIPPKVWAWKTFRIHKIAKLCDEVLGIFPFETAFYHKFGYRCRYIGNPTMDSIRAWQSEHSTLNARSSSTIAILPGSRKNEIAHCLPLMLKAARTFSEFHIVVAAAPGVEDDFYSKYLLHDELLTRDTYSLVSQARAAVVNSGTATLETALLGCPQQAVYYVAMSKVLGFLRPLLFKIPHFTLVNIILQREVIKEQVAYHFTERDVRLELERLLYDVQYRKTMADAYNELTTILGTTSAADNAARIISAL